MGIQINIGYSIHPPNISALNYYSPHKAKNDRCVSDVCSPQQAEDTVMFISLSLICLKDTKSQSQQLYSGLWAYGNICCSRVRSFFGNSYISDHLGIVVCSARDIYVSSTDSLYVPEWFNSKPTYWWIVIIKDGLWSLYFVLLGGIFHYVLCLLHSSLWKQPPRRLWN